MFRVEPTQEDQWKVVDENDKVAFIGTMREAEEWLDFQDNAPRAAAPASNWLRNAVNALHQPLAKLIAICRARRKAPGTIGDLGRQVRNQ